MICGVDEAGKGSVLGPLVIAAVSVTEERVVADLGVKDSKLLSPRERERLYTLIRRSCRIATVSVEAAEIDIIRREMTMNSCVARAHARAIGKLSPSRAVVDACDVNALRYAEMVKNHLVKPCEILSEHHADETYPVVSAASIIAKVTRDRSIKRLTKQYGEIGSGYPSDPVTITWLTGYIEEHSVPPPIARKSWKTVSALLARKSQTRLADF